MIAEVRRRTAAAVEAVEALEARRREAGDDAARAGLDQELAREVAGWVRAMEALGAEVKGRWLVDFDNGRGYYCWRWPEERLEYFHGYEEGFAGRVRIQ
jgi:hypothetical protein